MANPPNGRVKTDIRTRYKAQMERLVELAENAQKSMYNEVQPDWMIVEHNGWDGDLFNIPDMEKPFDRQEHYQDFADVVSDPNSPGTVADLMALQLQGDWLAAMERAFRERHKSHVRCMAQASARHKGHATKVFDTVLTGYIKRMLTRGAGGS